MKSKHPLAHMPLHVSGTATLQDTYGWGLADRAEAVSLADQPPRPVKPVSLQVVPPPTDEPASGLKKTSSPAA